MHSIGRTTFLWEQFTKDNEKSGDFCRLSDELNHIMCETHHRGSFCVNVIRTFQSIMKRESDYKCWHCALDLQNEIAEGFRTIRSWTNCRLHNVRNSFRNEKLWRDAGARRVLVIYNLSSEPHCQFLVLPEKSLWDAKVILKFEKLTKCNETRNSSVFGIGFSSKFGESQFANWQMLLKIMAAMILEYWTVSCVNMLKQLNKKTDLLISTKSYEPSSKDTSQQHWASVK